MTIKTLRKDYGSLSMLQRLSLLDNAISRGDESEAAAITAASPKKIFSQTDYCNLFEEINKIRMTNMVIRLSHMLTFDFLLFSGSDCLKNKSGLANEKRRTNHLKLAAFLYVRATDSWNAVSDELGLRPNYDEEIADILFPIDLLQVKDAMMREYAFSEHEAKQYIFEQTGRNEFATMEKEISEYRKYLELE